MRVTREVADVLNATFEAAAREHYEFATPELLLYQIAGCETFREAFENCGGDADSLQDRLIGYLKENAEPAGQTDKPEMSAGLETVLIRAQEQADDCGKEAVELQHLVYGFYFLKESYAVFYMETMGVGKTDLLRELTVIYSEIRERYDARRTRISREQQAEREGKRRAGRGKDAGADREEDDTDSGREEGREASGDSRSQRWRRYVTCVNEELNGVNPLIGREEELERTMQILCRKDKNNPLHVGEPGVGKTAIIYGLARLLNEERVPEPLKGARIFALDLGSLLAGTQYRGEFEKRFREIMDGISQEEKPIVYIDEIHNIVGKL